MLDIINVVLLGILAVVSVILVLFFVPVLRELRKTIGKVRGMADEEIAPLIAQVRDLVEQPGGEKTHKLKKAEPIYLRLILRKR